MFTHRTLKSCGNQLNELTKDIVEFWVSIYVDPFIRIITSIANHFPEVYILFFNIILSLNDIKTVIFNVLLLLLLFGSYLVVKK